ncbi:MAG: PilX N-terminal domain-containing pilus assembly protein [Pseudomonadota bacterium]
MNKTVQNEYKGNVTRQDGAVLFISLIMLLLLTLIGITGMQTTTFEERMAGNSRDRQMAFEAAETALLAAETYIEDNVIAIGAFDNDGSDALYDDSMEKIWNLIDWDGTDGVNTNEALSYSDFDSTYNIHTSPKYVIQHYATVTADEDLLNLDNYGQGTGAGETEMFRITVRGTGGSENAVVYIQNTYGKQL